MTALLGHFLEVFIPLFVALDPFGMVPVFLGVTDGMDDARRRRLSLQATAYALAICLGFMLAGQAMFRFLGIDQNDFKIAGGVLLLVLAVLDLLRTGRVAVDEEHLSGVVPLATPLMAGPATLSTILVLSTNYGYALTSVSIVLNLLLLMWAMMGAGRISRLLGADTMRALSKLVMILLAAIAVNFIRSGVVAVVRTVQ